MSWEMVGEPSLTRIACVSPRTVTPRICPEVLDVMPVPPPPSTIAAPAVAGGLKSLAMSDAAPPIVTFSM